MVETKKQVIVHTIQKQVQNSSSSGGNAGGGSTLADKEMVERNYDDRVLVYKEGSYELYKKKKSDVGIVKKYC